MSGANVQVQQLGTARHVANRAALGDRIAAAELDVEAVLARHRVKFAINVVRYEGRVVTQEIVLVDRKD